VVAIVDAPDARAAATVSRPIVPVPRTATRLPSTPSARRIACVPDASGSTIAASSSATSSGTGISFAAGTTNRSAIAPGI